MTIQRMDHVGIVVDDLAAATDFFFELGLRLQSEWPAEGDWVDSIVGLEGVRAQCAMLETPDGDGRLELVKFHAPPGPGADGHAPANAPGLRHLSFTVDDLDAAVAGVRAAAGSSSARWRTTRTSIGSATSAARRGSSSSWRSGSAQGADAALSVQPTDYIFSPGRMLACSIQATSWSSSSSSSSWMSR
jgi:catechol 2,3-dioxygenase-like lactoylglutathione lyase family enzyme